MPRLVHALTALMVTAWVWGDPTRRVLGRMEGEFRDHLWVSWLVRERVWVDHALPTFFPAANFPDGLSLYPLDPLNQLVLLGLAPLGVLPAFAILTFGLLVLAGLGADTLARAAGARAWPAALAGALYVIGPPVLGVYADTQTEGMGSGWVLLTLAALVEPAPWSRRRVVLLALCASASVLSAPYQAHALTLIGVPLALWRFRKDVALGALALALVAPAVLLAGVGLQTAETHADGQITHRVKGDGDWPPRTVLRVGVLPPQIDQVAAASPVAVHAWPREARFLPPTTGPRTAAGWVLPLLTLLALRERRARFFVAMAVAYGVLALGSARDYDWTALGDNRIPLPFDLWYRYFPLGRLAWKAQQYAVLAWAAGCVAVSLAPGGRWLLALVPLELQLTGPTPLPLPVVAVTPLPVAVALTTSAPGGVLEFPCRARGRFGPETLPADDLLHQLDHGHPIGEAFGRGFNRPRQGVVDALAATAGWVPSSPSVASALAFAGESGFRWLIVHGAALRPEERERVQAAIPGEPQVFPDGTLLYAVAP